MAGNEIINEPLGALRIDIEQSTMAAIKADSKALGIPAYILYRRVLKEFIKKTATRRKKTYMGK